jgi:hypothetical protein
MIVGSVAITRSSTGDGDRRPRPGGDQPDVDGPGRLRRRAPAAGGRGPENLVLRPAELRLGQPVVEGLVVFPAQVARAALGVVGVRFRLSGAAGDHDPRDLLSRLLSWGSPHRRWTPMPTGKTRNLRPRPAQSSSSSANTCVATSTPPAREHQAGNLLIDVRPPVGAVHGNTYSADDTVTRVHVPSPWPDHRRSRPNPPKIRPILRRPPAKAIIDKYHQQHPDVTIELSEVGGTTDTSAKLVAADRAARGP